MEDIIGPLLLFGKGRRSGSREVTRQTEKVYRTAVIQEFIIDRQDKKEKYNFLKEDQEK